jgi:hypothetical protein
LKLTAGAIFNRGVNLTDWVELKLGVPMLLCGVLFSMLSREWNGVLASRESTSVPGEVITLEIFGVRISGSFAADAGGDAVNHSSIIGSYRRKINL